MTARPVDQQETVVVCTFRPEVLVALFGQQSSVCCNPAPGIGSGPTHVEVFERPDGALLFSEIASRPGGGWIQLMISAYHGHATWPLAASAALTGGIPALHSARPYVGGISVRPTTPGVITEMPADEELRRYPA